MSKPLTGTVYVIPHYNLNNLPNEILRFEELTGEDHLEWTRQSGWVQVHENNWNETIPKLNALLPYTLSEKIWVKKLCRHFVTPVWKAKLQCQVQKVTIHPRILVQPAVLNYYAKWDKILGWFIKFWTWIYSFRAAPVN